VKPVRHGSPICSNAIRVFLLGLALWGADKAAFAGRLLGSPLAPLQGTVAADLDGDRLPDVATAGAGHKDSRGYLQEIRVRLGSSEWNSVTVRTSIRAHRLTVRDLDGDADRDLVLESFDREPLAILLNDGDGHFSLASVEDYRARLRHNGHPAIEGVGLDSPTPEMGESPGSPTAAPAGAGYGHRLGSSKLAAREDDPDIRSSHAPFCGRGPPRS